MEISDKLRKSIEDSAYSEKQKEDAFKIIEEYLPKIKKIYGIMTYNRDWGKEISVMTTPNFDIKLKFTKHIEE